MQNIQKMVRMEKEYKEYRNGSICPILSLTAAFFSFILAFIGYYLEGGFVPKTLGIFSFLLGLYLIALAISTALNPSLQTTEDEIIISGLPLVEAFHIPVKDITKVKMQMDMKIRPRVFIWYHYKDEIRQITLPTRGLRKEDQIEFRTFMENLTVSSESNKNSSGD